MARKCEGVESCQSVPTCSWEFEGNTFHFCEACADLVVVECDGDADGTVAFLALGGVA